ncbi:MAG: hypothetical protein ACI8RN_001302 [Glaciecola sp.]|jgi:hypothetical protein
MNAQSTAVSTSRKAILNRKLNQVLRTGQHITIHGGSIQNLSGVRAVTIDQVRCSALLQEQQLPPSVLDYLAIAIVEIDQLFQGLISHN